MESSLIDLAESKKNSKRNKTKICKYVSDEYSAIQMESAKLPAHIAIIMDGNGRWAKKRGLLRSIGHRFGIDALRLTVELCKDLGIKYLTVFAFSKENWNRPADEVALLMGLFEEYLDKEALDLHKKNIKMNFIGDYQLLNANLVSKIEEYTTLTKDNKTMIFTIAVNYGSRQEIVNAAIKLATMVMSKEIYPEMIDEAVFASCLDTSDLPNPDLLIRTSGEKRLSNFLLWQSAYSEVYFTDVFWPDFDREQLLCAIYDYQKRARRFGGL